ncbi:TIGR01841 family phasin [Sphingomonas sp. 2R-10]|uniref:phasin family protein n=1 Tax=Sphingomonas sp. 2R-10 TaxID=3045148 RepID=UPI0013DE65DF|nr:TIGR01841 family phasin [Sphingomonas sp. 2R-10]MDJ0278772.1 TIGR01841 family phasin [Sphingomonas sp. 2R-10]
MATRGPKTGARKPVVARSTRPVVTPPVEPVATPVVPAVADPAEADVPPVPFVAEPKAQPTELPFKAELPATMPAPVAEPVAKAAQAVVETAENAVEETTAAVETVSAQVEEKIMDVTNEATATTQNAASKAQNFAQEAASKAQAVTADFNEKAKAAFEKSQKGFEEMNELTKGNVEAFVEASRIAAKGLETLGQEMADYGRKSFEHATATAKTLATVKSPTEFMKLQSDFVRQSFDSFVAEASKTTELFIKLAGDAAQPISNRVAVAADKVKTVA